MDQQLKKPRVRVTMLIYSGRPDPEWELADDVANEVLDRIKKSTAGTPIAASPTPKLGFRGYLVQVEGPEPGTYEIVSGGVCRTTKGQSTVHADDAGVGELLREQAGQRGLKEPGGRHGGGASQ